MKIRKIALSNYRSIGAQPITIDFTKTVSVLIGKNNSGKSTVIDFLRLASHFAEVASKKGSSSSRHITEEDKHLKKSGNNPIVSIYLDRSHLQYYELEKGDVEGDPDIHFKVVGNKMNITSTFLEKLSNTGKINFLNTKGLGGINSENVDLAFSQYLGNLKANENYQNEIYSQFPEIILIDCTERLKNDEIQQIKNWRDPDPKKQEDRKLYRKFDYFVRELLGLKQYEIGFSATTNEVTLDIDGMILPLSSFGKGVERIIRIARHLIGVTDKLILLEEPETNLHPALQRAFFEYMIRDNDNKYVIATHSPLFATQHSDVEILHLKSVDLATIPHLVSADKSMRDTLEDIGIFPSDVLVANHVIWAEGPSDRVYLRHWIKLRHPKLKEYADYTIMTFGGDGISQFTVDEEEEERLINILKINPNCTVVLDSDRSTEDEEHSKEKLEFKTKCDENGINCIFTDGRGIENYVEMPVLERVLGTAQNKGEEIGRFEDFFDRKAFIWENKAKAKKKHKVRFARIIVNQFKENDLSKDMIRFINDVTAGIRKTNA